MTKLILNDVHRGPYEIDVSAGGVLLCDVDGTVADLTHRRKYVQKPKNYPAFEKTMNMDTPIQHVIDAVNTLYDAGWTVIMCTGRGAQNKDVTTDWLAQFDVRYHHILTRAFKDYRRDDIIKAELLAQIREMGYEPTLSFDDRNQVVDMWRANDIPCIQTAFGDF